VSRGLRAVIGILSQIQRRVHGLIRGGVELSRISRRGRETEAAVSALDSYCWPLRAGIAVFLSMVALGMLGGHSASAQEQEPLLV
jgi:hypothetical protein